jgi:sucrose-6-phosphate hydrolase SacC (GH32 family)
VLKVDGQYWMYASSTVAFDFPVLLYRLTANDDASYTRNPQEPILDVGDAEAWDAGGVETPAVVYFGGQYHLFWTGYPYEVDDENHSVFDYAIGHATSEDGVTWTRDSANPIIIPSGAEEDGNPGNDWYAFIVGEPGPVVHNGKIYLYFTAVGANMELSTSLQVIGVTTSSDGATWSAPELALKPDQALWPRDEGWVGYSTPNAIVLDGQVHLFYDVAYDPTGSDWKQVRLHHSYSADGKTDWTQDSTPIHSTEDFTWATEEVRSPHALLDGTVLRLYFAGHDAAYNLAIGQSTCNLAP